jgi:hypothetical protein
MVSSSLPEEGVNLKEYLSELEVNLIRQALDNQDWVANVVSGEYQNWIEAQYT